MVTRELEIVAENIVDTGLRSGLIAKSIDYYVSVHISYLSKNIVKVIINGDSESIDEFVDIIQREDVRVKRDTPRTYQVSELKEYLGPEIDWNRYELRFMSKQMYKGFREVNTRLAEIEHILKSRHS